MHGTRVPPSNSEPFLPRSGAEEPMSWLPPSGASDPLSPRKTVVAAAERRVGPVVAEEDDQGVLRDAELLQMVHHVPQGLVHALDERGVSAGGLAVRSILIMSDKALVNLEGIMYGVVGKIQEERLLCGDGRIDLRKGFQGQCFREESLGAVIFLQPGHGAGARAAEEAVAVLAQVAAGFADGRAGDVDVEPEVQRILARMPERREMALAHVDGPVTGLLQEPRESDVVRAETFPIPVIWAVVIAVVPFAADPVRDAVPGGVLPRQERGAGWGTDALCVELREADALMGKTFHVGRTVPVVQRIAHRIALAVGQERDGGVHDTHVVHQEQDDVRALLRLRGGPGQGQAQGEQLPIHGR